jgi:uncharacterized membrane protein (UPF0182 family)
VQNVRIWDWRALEPQLQQIQGLRPYYTFAGVDIDRYIIDGAERQVLITARELSLEKLPEQAKVWVNLALKYTHGYGAVAVPVNEMDGRGNPGTLAHDIPIKAKGDLTVTHGAIYYGALRRDRAYVRTTEKEFDFPQGQVNAETVYHGAGGIPLSSFWRKLVVPHDCWIAEVIRLSPMDCSRARCAGSIPDGPTVAYYTVAPTREKFDAASSSDHLSAHGYLRRSLGTHTRAG